MKISGVKKIKLNIFKNNKGDLLKFISKKNSFYSKFGEIYFNEINFKKKKRLDFTQKKHIHNDSMFW